MILSRIILGGPLGRIRYPTTLYRKVPVACCLCILAARQNRPDMRQHLYRYIYFHRDLGQSCKIAYPTRRIPEKWKFRAKLKNWKQKWKFWIIHENYKLQKGGNLEIFLKISKFLFLVENFKILDKTQNFKIEKTNLNFLNISKFDVIRLKISNCWIIFWKFQSISAYPGRQFYNSNLGD